MKKRDTWNKKRDTYLISITRKKRFVTLSRVSRGKALKQGGCLTGVSGYCKLARLGSLKREEGESRLLDP